MGFVTKEKFLSKDFFITYAWLLGGCFVFALGAVMFAEALWVCSRRNLRIVYGISPFVGVGD